MVKIYSILLGLTSLFISVSKGQVSNYVFSQATGTYSAIGGGTVFGNTFNDDQVFLSPAQLSGTTSGSAGSGIPMGFTFTLNNIVFDCFGINTNGWIFLGQSSSSPAVYSSSSSGYNAISSVSGAPGIFQHRVSAFSCNLQAQAGSSLMVQTIGTTPNQTCVIQWSNYRRFGATGENINFQIRLIEGSSLVEVDYGSFVVPTPFASCEVGLRGSSFTDYNNRSLALYSTWLLTSPGISSISACAFNYSMAPINGLRFMWAKPLPCAGTLPGDQATAIQTVVCQAAGVPLGLANTYTNTGLTFQWQSSTLSATGPFSTVAGANQRSLNASAFGSNTWYRAVVTCTNSLSTIISAPVKLSLAGTTVSGIPFFEGFENIPIPDLLPNCSWSSTSPGINCLTKNGMQSLGRQPRSGSGYASFKTVVNGAGDYFYTNGLQLHAGITYSAAMFFITDGLQGGNYLTLRLGTSQSSFGLQTVATFTGAVNSPTYQLLSGTFSVATSGIYYLAVGCSGGLVSQFLSFDDLSVTVPCTLNQPNFSIFAAGGNTICNGSSVLLSISGSNLLPSSSNSLLVSPQLPTTYFITGTNSITLCQKTASIAIDIKSSPNLGLITPNPTICAGSTTTLIVVSDQNSDVITWSDGQTGPYALVTPSVSNTYTVQATRGNGCSRSATLSVSLRNLPQVFALTSSSGFICLGEIDTLHASGSNLNSYVWQSGEGQIQTQMAIVSPTANTVYTLTGTDVHGCSNSTTVALVVQLCTSLNELNDASGVTVFPNPTAGQLTVSANRADLGTITIMDVAGSVVYKLTPLNKHQSTIALDNLPTGVYFVLVESDKARHTMKLLKQ